MDAFAGLRFTGDVHWVPKGRVVLPDEPILEVTAPIAAAQLVETYLLNQVMRSPTRPASPPTQVFVERTTGGRFLSSAVSP